MTRIPSLLSDLLSLTVRQGASDLHVQSGAPPALRLRGSIVFLDHPPLSAPQAEALLLPLIEEGRRESLLESGNLDLSFEVPGLARFRINFLLQHRGLGAVFRVIPPHVPTLAQLGLPLALSQISRLSKGLVLVTGPTGSGKSTTLAAMVQFVNEERNAHLITLEDPIEFVHTSNRALIQQREVGTHARSFAEGLRSALRESPDIILLGEMRDLDTITQALRAAETGHLVLATLHTSSAARTLDRLIDVFPVEDQESVRSLLSGSLKAVIAQQLVPTADGGDRVVAQEIMVVTMGIAGLIREGKSAQISSFISTGREEGMQTMDQALVGLVRSGRITARAAFERCHDADALLRAGLRDQT